jgi:hypothetical protein
MHQLCRALAGVFPPPYGDTREERSSAPPMKSAA